MRTAALPAINVLCFNIVNGDTLLMETFILIHYKKDDATLINDAVTYISCFQSRLFILMAYLKFENFTFY